MTEELSELWLQIADARRAVAWASEALRAAEEEYEEALGVLDALEIELEREETGNDRESGA